MPTRAEIQRELEWRRCSRDPVYFLQKYFFIRHPERGRILFELRPAQLETLDHWLKRKLTITLKARQIGFSTLAAGLTLWHIFFHADRYIIMLSRTERDAQKLLAKVAYGFKWLPEWMTDKGPKLLTDNLQKMVYDNDSSVESLPASDPARGESAYMIFVDEWAFFPNPDEAYAAIEPATDIGGRIAALSTANGAGNLFHTMWVDAVAKKSDFHPIFFPWSAATERSPAWYESKKRSMQDWQLHQEYPCTPEEAFIKSGNPVFDIDLLDSLELQAPTVGYMHRLDNGPVEFRANQDGPLAVWENPQPGIKYAIGADVAEGLEHGDYSVAHVINTLTGKVAARWRGHVDPDLFGSETLHDLGRWYNTALVGPEVNNHGYATCAALQATGYPNVYYRHTYDERTMRKGKKIGWRTQVNTKPLAIDELAAALRNTELQLYDEETIGELRTFVRDGTGKMHGSPWDDCTMSLAIANQMRKHVWTLIEQAEQEDWVPPADDYAGDWVVGAHSQRSGAMADPFHDLVA